MSIQVDSAALTARRIRFGDLFTLEEARLQAEDISLSAAPGGAIRIGSLTGTLVATESAVNHALHGRAEDSLSDLRAAFLTGRMRIEGRYRGPLGLPIPFAFTSVPEIEGGARIRLDPRKLSVVAGVPVPGALLEFLGERINARLARALDVSRLPFAVRLTDLKVETGRILLSGTATLEVSPRTSDSA